MEERRVQVAQTIVGLRHRLNVFGNPSITKKTDLLGEAKELADVTGVRYEHVAMPAGGDEEGQLSIASNLLDRVHAAI